MNPDWDPRSPSVLHDQMAAYDHMRHTCPVAYSHYLHYSVFRHADVLRILLDHDTFSSNASRHISVPNSMDPPLHTAFRQLIEPFFNAEHIAAFTPRCHTICQHLVASLKECSSIEIMSALANPFALQMQCAFLGWPDSVHTSLLQWIDKKNAATLSGDMQAVTAVAHEFDDTIKALLAERRLAGHKAPNDITTQLLYAKVMDRVLTEEEIISILRNWTVGELGTMASSIGIISHYLAHHPDIQAQLRQNPSLIRAANDEILRIHAPLIANRRSPTCPVKIGEKTIPAGERITLIWASANRDETVFDDPDEFRLDRDPSLNLLYGAGIHVCPGAPLARLEIETMIRTLLANFILTPTPQKAAKTNVYPASGFSQVFLDLVKM